MHVHDTNVRNLRGESSQKGTPLLSKIKENKREMEIQKYLVYLGKAIKDTYREGQRKLSECVKVTNGPRENHATSLCATVRVHRFFGSAVGEL
jgi:hypothetical protein